MDYPARRKARADATRRAILGAAIELSREKGFDKITVRDVCARAGVTTGAFYHHFASKDDILNQGFTSVDAYLEEAMATCAGRPPIERLEVLLHSYAQYTEDVGWQTMAHYYDRRLIDPAAASISPDRYTLRAMIDCFEELTQDGELASAYTPEWVADFCFRHFRGIVIDWILHKGEYPLWPKLSQDYQFFFTAFRS